MDRTFRGFVAGLIAGVIFNIWNLTNFYFFHIANLRLLDWVAVLTSGEKSQTGLQVITDLVIQIVWDGILGIIFAHLLTKISSKGIIIKSCLFGSLLYFIFRAIAVLFKISPLIAGQTFPGRLSDLLGAVIWGIILGFFLKRFNKIQEDKGDIRDW